MNIDYDDLDKTAETVVRVMEVVCKPETSERARKIKDLVFQTNERTPQGNQLPCGDFNAQRGLPKYVKAKKNRRRKR